MIYYWSFLAIVLGVYYGVILTTANNCQPIPTFIMGMIYYHILYQTVRSIKNATRKAEK